MEIEAEAMTLQAFRASRVEVADLAAALGWCADPAQARRSGFVYVGQVYIEVAGEEKLHLQLYGQEYLALRWRLAELEAVLYQWVLTERGWRDNSPEHAAATKAAAAILAVAGGRQARQAVERTLIEPQPGVCCVQDVADVWPIIARHADEGADLDLAYELVRGILAQSA